MRLSISFSLVAISSNSSSRSVTESRCERSPLMISDAVRLTESMRLSTLVPIHRPPIRENSSVSSVAPTTSAKV